MDTHVELNNRGRRDSTHGSTTGADERDTKNKSASVSRIVREEGDGWTALSLC